MDTRVDVYKPEKIKCIPYEHHVKYYETDQMAIVHHSNYIRWFEEARCDFMDQIGVSYQSVEARGILIPVVDVSCNYLISARYGDQMEIRPILTQYTGVRMSFRYEVRFAADGRLAATGTSSHCFLDENRRPTSRISTLFRCAISAMVSVVTMVLTMTGSFGMRPCLTRWLQM